MNLSERQKKIIEIVQKCQPITGNDIADKLGYTKPTLRPDLSFLTRSGILSAKPNVGYILNQVSTESEYSASIFHKKVKDVKSSAVYIEEECSIHNAIVKIFLKDAGTIFVVDKNGYLSGVVSRKDFLKSIMGKMDIHNVPVGVIMTRMPNIITTNDDETILQAAIKIMDHKIDSMPVVEYAGNNLYKITGKISKTNISQVFVEMGKNSGK
ncbi:MAG: DeoR family transcriptional regulator, catabolite repression regulator [Clostridiales bacterium]|jgi:CBS domain-containing protein/biotin operon repressor|nr:DeoR family transcriptional regulator, catabolite repression regulator [Clostridiales bacterium]MDK2933008.1 DeoR family transcriptional regulator, catabolite repression regulator [Clostridiales bacterium]